MSAKAATFEILRSFKKGDRFTGYDLMLKVKHKTGEIHYPSTMLRYLREYRESTGIRIVNVDKKRSIYEIF